MGCDIHLFIEYRANTGTWLSLSRSEIEIPRDYDLFFSLANVRAPENHPKKLRNRQPRGLPGDLSKQVAEAYYAAKESYKPHSESHLYADKLEVVLSEMVEKGETDSYFGCIESILNLVYGLEDDWGHGNARIVFWFDN